MARANNPERNQRFVLLATICLVIALLYFASEVLIPLALAVLLTFLLAPLVIRLERWGLQRVPSTIIVVILALAAVAGVGYGVFTQAQELGEDLPRYSENISNKLSRLLPKGGGMFAAVERTAEKISQQVAGPATAPASAPAQVAETGKHPEPPGTRTNPLWVMIGGQVTSPFKTLQATVLTLLHPLGVTGIVIVFTIFMLLAREDLRDRLIRLIGQGQITVTTQAIDDAATRISRYLLMQSLINGGYGIAISLGLLVIGVPNPLLFGLMCALLRFVPYLGAWLGAAFPIIVSIGNFPGSAPVLETVALFLVVELITNNVFEPLLYGSSTGLSTVAVLVAAVFWTWLWGPIGLLLSTPLTVIVVVLGKYVPQLAFLDILLSDTPAFEPAERFYQRLLALDQEEAMELAQERSTKSSLTEAFEAILLPALAMAVEDVHRGNLDRERLRFIYQAMRDIIDELGEDDVAPTRSHGGVDAVLVPAYNEADELAALMLQQLLEARGYSASVVSSEKLSSEILDEINELGTTTTVISALPPSGIMHARRMCKRIRMRFPEIKTVIGVWLFKGDLAKARQRVGCNANEVLTPSLEDALAAFPTKIPSPVEEPAPAK